VAALQFFFTVTVNHPELGRHHTLVPLPERPRVNKIKHCRRIAARVYAFTT